MRPRQGQRLRRVLAAGAGDDHLRHALFARALHHRLAIVIEALVGQVGADVDELHAKPEREVGRWIVRAGASP
ncbi:hypothetical protein D3C87_2109010 [compost metagenome]